MEPRNISQQTYLHRILNLGTGEFEELEHRNTVYMLAGWKPELGTGVYVHHSAQVIGSVRLGPRSSVWCHAVVRGDGGAIQIGEESNVQDNAVIHSSPGRGVNIGDGVSIGHGAIVHGCTIAGNCLIGNNATVMDGAVIQEDTLVAASAIVAGARTYEPGVLLAGNPARVKRRLSPADVEHIRKNAQQYTERACQYRRALRKTYVMEGCSQ